MWWLLVALLALGLLLLRVVAATKSYISAARQYSSAPWHCFTRTSSSRTAATSSTMLLHSESPAMQAPRTRHWSLALSHSSLPSFCSSAAAGPCMVAPRLPMIVCHRNSSEAGLRSTSLSWASLLASKLLSSDSKRSSSYCIPARDSMSGSS